jgi:hypothetical protein
LNPRVDSGSDTLKTAGSSAPDQKTAAGGRLSLARATAAIVVLGAAGPVAVLAIKGQIVGAAVLAGATVALAAVALRYCTNARGTVSVRFRLALLAMAVGQAAVLAAAVAALGFAYINLDSLHDERLFFHLLVTVPLGLGLLTVVLALLPPMLRANLILFLVFWLVAEFIFSWMLPAQLQGDPRSLVKTDYKLHSPIGYVLAPNNRAMHIKRIGNRQVMNATYVIDNFGRRLTLPYAADGRTNFLLFFGDSNTFGEGLNQTETLPYQVALLAPHYHPYNYGVSGYGPAQALDLIKARDLRLEIAEPQGLALFVFLPTLLDRVRGGSLVSTDWGRHFSRYETDSKGRLVRRGDFVHSRPLLTLFYYLVTCSNIAAYFDLTLPRKLSDSDFELTARVLAESQRQLKNQLNVRGFYVVLAPVTLWEAPIARHLIPFLREQGLPYLDLTRMFDADKPGYRLPDYHLSALSDRLIAQRLVNDLKIGAPRAPGPLDP